MKAFVRHGRPLLVLAAWTLLVWVGRIRNVISVDDLDGWAFTWRLAVALGFVGAGAALGITTLSGRPVCRTIGAALAAVGIAWWLIRGGAILVGDYEFGFKAVHTVLALTTVALGAWVLRSTGLSRSLAPDDGDRYHPPRYG